MHIYVLRQCDSKNATNTQVHHQLLLLNLLVWGLGYRLQSSRLWFFQSKCVYVCGGRVGEGEGRGLSPFLPLSLYSIVYQSVYTYSDSRHSS